jgi:hypothetical protein
LDTWVEEAQKTRPSLRRGIKPAFKKFLVAINQKGIKDIFVQIASHSENISLSLSVIGR